MSERVRPIKIFEVLVAYGPYRVGDRIQPTGMYRDVLLRRCLIREVAEMVETPAPRRAGADAQAALPEINRMVPTGALSARGSRRR